MSLVVPTVGQDPGPQYATDVNTSLGIIDQHNHTPGSGVLITPLAMSINTNLTFAGNFATNIAGATFSTQSSTPANKTIYSKGNDLYFVDALGNNIQITQSGGIAGTPGSISNLTSPASASYVAVGATFVWQSGVNLAANMDFASAILRNISPNSTFGLTLSPPSALSNDYTITLPILPGSNLPLSINSSGTMSAALITGSQIANVTISGSNIVNNTITATQIANNTITATQIANNTITATQIANGTITPTQIQANSIGHASLVAPVFGSAAVNNGTYGNGNLMATFSLTTIGGPVSMFIDYSAATGTVTAPAGGTGSGSIECFVDSVSKGHIPITVLSDGSVYGNAGATVLVPTLSAGAHTLEIKYNQGSYTNNITTVSMRLNAFEIK